MFQRNLNVINENKIPKYIINDVETLLEAIQMEKNSDFVEKSDGENSGQEN